SIYTMGRYHLPIEPIIVESDDGDFAVPFVWEPWDTFTHDLSASFIDLGAYSEDNPDAYRHPGQTNRMIGKVKGTIRGVLRRDIIGLVTGTLTSSEFHDWRCESLHDISAVQIDGQNGVVGVGFGCRRHRESSV